MKLYKRVAAVLLACLLALSFAACGGGGGGGTGSGGIGGGSTATKIANTPLTTGIVTLKGTFGGDSIQLGSNGTSTYFRETNASSDVVYLKSSSGIYGIDLTAESKTAQNMSSDSTMKTMMELIEAILNAKNNLSNATVGKTKVNGTEYYSETTTAKVEGTSYNIAYCFEGNTLKYIVVSSGTPSKTILTIAVDSVENGVKKSLLTTNGWLSGDTSTTTGKVTVSVTSVATAGLVSGAGVYNKGDSVTMKATPATGYTFVCWQKDGTTVSTNASYTFTAYKSVTLTAVWSSTSNEIPVDEAHFPDAVFRSYVSTNIDKDNNGGLNNAEIAAVTEINVADEGGNGITNLKGIEYFTSLITLYCDGSSLSTLDVSKNTALKYLECSNSTLTSLNISKNLALKELDCAYNNLTSLNVSNNTALESLICDGNSLASLNVSNNHALKTLSCRYTNLTSLNVANNPLLEQLMCTSNHITSLDMSNNPALEFLQCEENGMTSLILSNKPALKDLYCQSNKLSSLDVTKSPVLEGLYCQDNQLTSLDVSKNTSLETLCCQSNNLSNLDISSNKVLERLYYDSKATVTGTRSGMYIKKY